MLIIAGKLFTAPEDRDKFVDGHREVVMLARKAPGCVDIAISADPVDETRVNMIEQWESEEALNAWRAIAPAPSVQVQIKGGDVLKHQISASGPPF